MFRCDLEHLQGGDVKPTHFNYIRQYRINFTILTSEIHISTGQDPLRIEDKIGVCMQRKTALQAGRSLVRFPVVSLVFFIDIILPAALWPWGRLSL